MKLQIKGEEEPFVEPDGSGEPSDSEGQTDAQLSEGNDAARSAENIARWRLYLPQDCIGAMIRAGWDRTT